MHVGRQAIAVLLLGLPVAPLFGQDSGDRVVGYILGARGVWLVGSPAEEAATGRILVVGDTLRPGPPPWIAHEVVIVARDGDATRYRCGDPPATAPTPDAWDCTRPIVPASPTPASLYARLVDAVMHHFVDHPPGPTSLVSRAPQQPELREAVAILAGYDLELADALSAVPTGDYDLRLVPTRIDSGVPDAGPGLDARIAWNPAAPVMIRAPTFSPGLYALSLTGTPDTAWVFVCVGSDCERVRGEFRRIRAMLTRWEGKVSASDARAFARVALDLLAREESGP